MKNIIYYPGEEENVAPKALLEKKEPRRLAQITRSHRLG